jgi:hypothetical protein
VLIFHPPMDSLINYRLDFSPFRVLLRAVKNLPRIRDGNLSLLAGT